VDYNRLGYTAQVWHKKYNPLNFISYFKNQRRCVNPKILGIPYGNGSGSQGKYGWKNTG